METKRCARCKETFLLNNFAKDKYRKSGIRPYCKNCDKLAQAEYRARNIDKIHQVAEAKRKENRTLLWDYFKTHPCVDCGETDPVVLQFDHLRDKEQHISHMVTSGKLWARILEEIAKCEVVCANCHFRRTAKQFGWHKAMFN